MREGESGECEVRLRELEIIWVAVRGSSSLSSGGRDLYANSMCPPLVRSSTVSFNGFSINLAYIYLIQAGGRFERELMQNLFRKSR